MQRVEISAGNGYDVSIGSGLLGRCGEMIGASIDPCRAVLVTDSTVESLYAAVVEEELRRAGFATSVFSFAAGEGSKTIKTLSRMLEFMASEQLTRTDCVVALGGGVVGDLAGFCAGCFLRGIRYVQMPTTLLAAVDSSVGGKTAVNLAAGKNLAGLFWQPSAVICDTDCLRTLPSEVFADGMAEAIKTGILDSEELFSLLESEVLEDRLGKGGAPNPYMRGGAFDCPAQGMAVRRQPKEDVSLDSGQPEEHEEGASLSSRQHEEDAAVSVCLGGDGKAFKGQSKENTACGDRLEDIIARCVAFKARVVEADEQEEGLRKTLNLGHTIGHAIEACSGYTVSHGHAVAAGLAMITHAATALGYCDAHDASRIVSLLSSVGLPVSTQFSTDELMQAILHDKKRSGDSITLVLPRGIGSCFLHEIALDALPKWLDGGRGDTQ